MMVKKIICFVFLVFFNLPVWAQSNYPKQYQDGKDLFRQGKYNLAMETFKPLITYDQKNQYSPYASFYYAVSAFRQGYLAVAKDMFLQIKSVHSKWDKLDEVNLWLAKVYLQDGDYFQGIKTLNLIQDKNVFAAGQAVKAQHLAEITDAETMKMMLEEFPKDEVVAKSLARVLVKDLTDDENKQMLESLIDQFKLERADYIPEAPKTFHKDRYSVSVLFPFMLETLDSKPGKKRNQIVLDFYEGIKLAVDSLNQRGPQINLRAYDTDKGLDHLKRLLQTEELTNTDLVIGPLYPEENDIVQEFSLNNQVNVVNPFSNNTDLIGVNPYAYLFQPSSETIGKKAAEYVAEHARKNVCMVFFGSSRKDSVLAASFIEKGNELGLQVVASQRVFKKDEALDIITILATPTEFEEVVDQRGGRTSIKYASEFTLKKDSIGSIFVATDDPLIYTKVISAVETRGDSLLVVGSENWIDETAVAFEKYQSLGVVFSAPNFVSSDSPRRRAFTGKYLEKYGRVPSRLSLLGYEMMLLFGNQLKTNGVYFQDGLNSAGFLPGHLFQGFKYQYTRDNQVVPFVKFKDGVLTLIEKR